MLKLTSFIYFVRQLIVSSRREKQIPSLLTLQNLFFPVREIFSVSPLRWGSTIFAFKASIVRFSFSRDSVVRKNFCCWIYFSSKGFALYIFSGVHSETIDLKIKMSVKKKCYSAQEILKNIAERTCFMSEQILVSYPREKLSQPL